MAIVNHVREVREARGLGRYQLALLADVSPTWLQVIELGHVPGGAIRRRLAEALGVDEGELWPAEAKGEFEHAS
jgi:transcriptional regulator with XRE-family HTH domain